MKQLNKNRIRNIVKMVKRGSNLTPSEIAKILNQEGYQATTQSVKGWLSEYTCSIKGCNGFPVGKGLCMKHYLRNRRHGNPAVNIPVGRPEIYSKNSRCEIPGCQRRPHARNMCKKHYTDWLRSNQ